MIAIDIAILIDDDIDEYAFLIAQDLTDGLKKKSVCDLKGIHCIPSEILRTDV